MLGHNKGKYQDILTKCLNISGQSVISGQFQDSFEISGISGITGRLWPLLSYKYKNERSLAFRKRQNPFLAGAQSAPDPAGEAYDAPPDSLVGWRGDTPPHTQPHWAPIHLRPSSCVPHQNSSQIYAYALDTFGCFVAVFQCKYINCSDIALSCSRPIAMQVM